MDIKLAYGIRNGRVVHISELEPTEKGEKCNCTCPECGGVLVARLGKKRKPHFAHKTSIDCKIEHAQETGLHKLAKEIIQENSRILVPGLSISRKEVEEDVIDQYAASKVVIDLPNIKALEVDYDSVEIEKPIDDIIADAVIRVKELLCIVEIGVTHFVDKIKEEKLEKIGISAFEIDLRNLVKKAPTRTEIKEAVLFDETNRKWVFNHKREQLLTKKKAEFQRGYGDAVLKREQDTKQKKEIQQKKVQIIKELMIPINYANELNRLRNDEQAAYCLKQFSFRKELSEYPFYMDIPITGEFVFACDRRVWQGKLFNDYVYWGDLEYANYFIHQIQERIFDGKMIIQYDNMIIRYDSEKAFPTPFSTKGQEREISYSQDVIQRYFEYLELLGFVSNYDNVWHSTSFKTLEPPYYRIAGILKDILRSVDRFSPNINQIIKRELLSRLNGRKQREVREWD